MTPKQPTVLIVSQTAAEPARDALPKYEVMVAPTDPDALQGRDVVLWPDADTQSREAFARLAATLIPVASRLRAVNTADVNSGWGIHNAVADGWDGKQIIAWAKARIIPVDAPPKTDPAKVPRETKRSRKPAGSEPTASGAPAYVLWEQLQLARNERGPYATEANALRIIAAHGSYAGRIWLDEFSQRLMIDDPDADHGCRLFSRTDALAMLVWMQESLQLPKMPLSAVERAAVLVGERNKRHPLRDWLESLSWDSCVRLPTSLADGWGVEQSEYSAGAGRCWFTALVARVFEPGCKADHVVVFEGAQGMTKSTALSIIGDRWFLETTKNPVRDPDKFLQALQGKWLVEIPEIDRIGGRSGDLSDLTGLITITTDTYRMPYAPTAMDYPRQCIFTGTANRSSNWQPDETGGRRYWPVVCREINLDYLRANREQLFAEAVHRYRAGESWWDVPADEAREQQEARRITDEWEGIIERFMNEYPDRRDWQSGVIWSPRTKPLEFVTVASVLEEALGLPESKWDTPSQKRVVKALAALQMSKQRPTIDGKRVWVYAKANTFAAVGSGK